MDILAPDRTPETRDGTGMAFSMESEDPKFTSNLVNDYLRLFDTETTWMLDFAGRNTISSQIRDTAYTIASKLEMAKVRRLDRVVEIEGAAEIAGILGVRDRVDTTNVVQNNQLNISKSSTPLYYRSYRALNAEINILKNRKSDDPFISGLRDFQEKLALLHSNKIEAEGMHAVTVDQAAYPSINYIKTNHRLIVSPGTVVGLFLGNCLVFFASFVQKQKETHSK